MEITDPYLDMMNRYILSLIIFLLSITHQSHSANQDSIRSHQKFINLGIWGDRSTNKKDANITTNNISISLIYGHNKNLYGFSLAPFSNIDSTMIGLQLGISNLASNVIGAQIGLANDVRRLKGIQIGMGNLIQEVSGGVQIGVFNSRISDGLQIGLLNVAKHNNYSIGIINIIEDGDINVGITIDEMSNTTATLRSGSKYLYGVVGLGYSFASSLNQIVVEAGIGVHALRTSHFDINTEFVFTHLGRTFASTKSDDDYQEKLDKFDFKNASRLTFRLLTYVKISKKIELFGGPSINYLQSHHQDNRKIFPSHYYWRKFTDHSLKQIYWGYNIGIQYKLK